MFSLKTIVFHFVSFRERKTSNLLPFEAVETFATECGVYDKSEVINIYVLLRLRCAKLNDKMAFPA